MSTLVSIPIQLVTGPVLEQMVETLRGSPEMPPEVIAMLAQFGEFGVFAILIGFIFMLFLGLVFSTLGGVLGAVIFGRGREGQPVSPA